MLSDEQINRIIDRYIKDHKGTRVLLANREDIINAYKDIAVADLNKNRTTTQHEILVQNALTEIDLSRGLSIQQNLRNYKQRNGDLRFLTYLDEFIYQGAASDIAKALRENNLPYDALRGIKLHQNQRQESIPFVEVEQHWISNKYDVPESPYVADKFDIYYKGQLIYSLNNYTQEELFEKTLKYAGEESKSVSGKSAYLRLFETEDGDYIYQIRTKKGIRYKDTKGNWASPKRIFGGVKDDGKSNIKSNRLY